MTYVRRKAPLIVAVFTAQDTWRNLTPAQRRALVGDGPVHPRVHARLHEMGLRRKDGKPTKWGLTVLRFTALMRADQ